MRYSKSLDQAKKKNIHQLKWQQKQMHATKNRSGERRETRKACKVQAKSCVSIFAVLTTAPDTISDTCEHLSSGHDTWLQMDKKTFLREFLVYCNHSWT